MIKCGDLVNPFFSRQLISLIHVSRELYHNFMYYFAAKIKKMMTSYINIVPKHTINAVELNNVLTVVRVGKHLTL